MQTGFDQDETARTLIERRWFALHSAVGRLQRECEVLAGVMHATQEDWLEARSRLAELQAARDELGEALSQLDDCGALQPVRGSCAMDSAA